MIALNLRFKLYLILTAVFSLHCDRIVNGLNISTELEGGRKSKREISKRSADNALPTVGDERKQRFCLNRLRDALQTVCSSEADNIPHYFNPNLDHNQLYATLNSSNFHFGLERKSRHFRNEISAMAKPKQNRPLLRRRSRRNIVRQCCDKPCSYESMRKYCSPTGRQTPTKPNSVQVASQQDRLPTHSNDVTIETKANGSSNALLENAELLTSQSNNLLLNTNPTIPGLIAPTPNPAFEVTQFYSKFSQKSSTQEDTPMEENKQEDNSIMEQASSLNLRKESNTMTAKPITSYISLPRGTNDYIY